MRIAFMLRRTLALYVFCLFILAGLLSSCGNTRQLTYLQGQFDTAQLSKIPIREPVIRKGDVLSIVIFSDNPAATAVFNQQGSGNTLSFGGSSGGSGGGDAGGSSGAAAGGGGGSPSSPTYLVDEKGNIEFPQLGLLHVDSLTRSQLKDTLEERLKVYLIKPYSTIRFLNYRVTMLGEVMRPGIFPIPGEKVNLLEALGMSGDLTFFGRRDNILVIRDNNGKREFGRLDLTKPEVMASSFFYLQPNDVVYVEASRKKIAANDQSALRAITISASVISTLSLLYTIFKK